jgi:hypothetical protein
MNCILDLNFDILNKINDEVIKKRKLMKYLDNIETAFKCESSYLFYHINMLKYIYNDDSIIQVLEKDEDNESTNLLDIEYCIELDRLELEEKQFNNYYDLE